MGINSRRRRFVLRSGANRRTPTAHPAPLESMGEAPGMAATGVGFGVGGVWGPGSIGVVSHPVCSSASPPGQQRARGK